MEGLNDLDDAGSRIQQALKQSEATRFDLSDGREEYLDLTNFKPACLTHPPSYDFSHIKAFETFQDHLARALKGAFPIKANEYDGVYSLLIDWRDDDLGCASEIRDLDAQLKKQFRFQTEKFSIPTFNSERMLQDRLIDFERAHREGSNLLIIYYGGHGQFNLQGNSVWRANLRGDSATVNWYSLQPILERSPCDIFLIFDCCYAASAARSAPDGTTELLAACGRENKTSPVCDYSFTRVLMEELSSFGSNPFTVAQLHTRLIKERKKLRNTPIHAFISDESHGSIRIAPISSSGGSSSVPNSPDRADSSLGTGESSSLDDRTSHITVPTTPSISPSVQEPCVLLAVSLEHNAISSDVGLWSKWLTSGTPQGIKDISVVKIEAAFVSHSTLLLVSLPVTVWNLLPETSAYRFVDYIRSPDISMHLRCRETTKEANVQDHFFIDDHTPRAKSFDWPATLENREGVEDLSTDRRRRARRASARAKKAMGQIFRSKSKKEVIDDDASNCSESSPVDHTFSEPDDMCDRWTTPGSSAIQSARQSANC